MKLIGVDEILTVAKTPRLSLGLCPQSESWNRNQRSKGQGESAQREEGNQELKQGAREGSAPARQVLKAEDAQGPLCLVISRFL